MHKSFLKHLVKYTPDHDFCDIPQIQFYLHTRYVCQLDKDKERVMKLKKKSELISLKA